jgi:glycosyltransferase involved in cell wall biosynthesis
MRHFYRACDVVCVPSRAEPFGRTVIEAFAVGAPVVASAVGGICETIADGRTGFLVQFDDAEGLARALQRLLREADLGTRLADAARQDALDKYRVSTYHARINEIVAHALVARTTRQDA